MLKQLQDYVNIVQSSIEGWKTTPWRKIDVENMDIECKKFAKEIRGQQLRNCPRRRGTSSNRAQLYILNIFPQNIHHRSTYTFFLLSHNLSYSCAKNTGAAKVRLSLLRRPAKRAQFLVNWTRIFFSAALDKEMRPWDAYVSLEATVKNMLTSLRAVGELQNPAIRERHWRQLMNSTKVSPGFAERASRSFF